MSQDEESNPLAASSCCGLSGRCSAPLCWPGCPAHTDFAPASPTTLTLDLEIMVLLPFMVADTGAGLYSIKKAPGTQRLT